MSTDRIAWVLGKKAVFKRSVFQAAAAALTLEEQLPTTLTHLTTDSRFTSCSYFIRAHRTKVASGWDDGGEAGAGQKLLHLLERMGIENIIVIVFVWDNGGPCSLGSALFRMIIDRAKELLVTVHAQVVRDLPPPPAKSFQIKQMNLDSLPEANPRQAEVRDVAADAEMNLPDFNSLMTKGDVRSLETHLHSNYVKAVLTAACSLLQKTPPTWDDVKELVFDRDLYKKLRLIKTEVLKASQVQRAQKALKFPRDVLQTELRRVSQVALSLYKIVIYILNSHIKSTKARTGAEQFEDDYIESPDHKDGRFLPVKEMHYSGNSKPEMSIVPPPPEDSESSVEPDDVEILSLLSKQLAQKEQDFRIPPAGAENEPIDPEDPDARKKYAMKKKEEEEARIKRLLEVRLEEYEINTSIAASLTDDQTLHFLKSNKIEEQSVDVLLALANRLKQRRTQLLSSG
mmetsp:Transcript_8389/g.16673  ORF Transcript_8389/g.16673 Transcript_8389/m.16673 type:complete len:457 (+) Transcript_8389:5240-6610(+)